MCFYRANSVGEVRNSNKARLLVVKIPKNDVDKAHKDKQNKIFSSDFTVRLFLVFSMISILLSVHLNYVLSLRV